MKFQMTVQITEDDVQMLDRIRRLFPLVYDDGAVSEADKERWSKAINKLSTRNNDVHMPELQESSMFLGTLAQILIEQTTTEYWRRVFPDASFVPDSTLEGLAQNRIRDYDEVSRYLVIVNKAWHALRQYEITETK